MFDGLCRVKNSGCIGDKRVDSRTLYTPILAPKIDDVIPKLVHMVDGIKIPQLKPYKHNCLEKRCGRTRFCVSKSGDSCIVELS